MGRCRFRWVHLFNGGNSWTRGQCLCLPKRAAWSIVSVCCTPPIQLVIDRVLHILAVFSDCWQALLNDVTNLAKEVSELLRGRVPEKQVYMSLPRPGVSFRLIRPLARQNGGPDKTGRTLLQSVTTIFHVSLFLPFVNCAEQKHGTTSKPLKPGKLDSEVRRWVSWPQLLPVGGNNIWHFRQRQRVVVCQKKILKVDHMALDQWSRISAPAFEARCDRILMFHSLPWIPLQWMNGPPWKWI